MSDTARPARKCANPRCNKRAVPVEGRKNFCSDGCRDEYTTSKRDKTPRYPPRVCSREGCGREYVPKRRDQKYCGENCLTLGRRARNKAQTERRRTCPHCGKSLLLTNPRRSRSVRDSSSPPTGDLRLPDDVRAAYLRGEWDRG